MKIIEFLNSYAGVFLVIVSVLLLFLIYQVFNLSKKLAVQKRRYDMLLRGRGEFNLEELLKAHSIDIENINAKLDEMKLDVSSAKSRTAFSLQKIGFVKYDAFSDLKNKLSFSVAMLDSFDNGMIFTTIYGRESCITYAKEVLNGKATQELSGEEEDALKKALNR